MPASRRPERDLRAAEADHLELLLGPAALADAGVDPLPDEIALERPANRDHGDWSSNVALATAKKAGKNPRELGQALVDHLAANPPAHVTAVEIAGPGFVNFRLADSWLYEVLTDVLDDELEQTRRELEEAGARVKAYRVDVTDPDVLATPAAAAYAGPAFELMSHGLLTPEYAAELQSALATAYGPTATEDTEKGLS